MKQLTVLTLVILATLGLRANDEDSLTAKQEQSWRDSVEQSMKYETGQIKISDGIALLNIPQGFKFLNATQSQYVLSELWGNPPDSQVLGIIFPETTSPFSINSYAFIVSYQAVGYVKDADADKVHYDDLLSNMKAQDIADNEERKKMGFATLHTVGWAQEPFYDKNKKVLHWALELKGQEAEENTLNYDVRILGRKGILTMNAVADISELELVKKDIDKVLEMPRFTEGNQYGDFDSNVDEVAAWTIGGLVAGKVLAKVGVLAFVAKYLKLIIMGIVAIGALVFGFFRRKKSQDNLA